jgi:hypothetical protein
VATVWVHGSVAVPAVPMVEFARPRGSRGGRRLYLSGAMAIIRNERKAQAARAEVQCVRTGAANARSRHGGSLKSD